MLKKKNESCYINFFKLLNKICCTGYMFKTKIFSKGLNNLFPTLLASIS